MSIPLFASAQLEYANWVWPDSNFVSWTSGSPVDSVGPYLPFGNLTMGATSISDKQGNLLIVSEGYRALNGAGQVMVNGIGLGQQNNEDALICPKPCSDSIYYLFVLNPSTLGNPSGKPKLYYFEVNPYANGGQGEVLNPSGVLLDSNLSFAADICRHRNNSDFWLISRKTDNATFRTWHITDTGVVSSPVTSVIGTSYPDTVLRERLDISPNGEWIAVSTKVIGAPSLLASPQDLYQFDAATGAVSYFCPLIDTIIRSTGSTHYSCFSPNSSKLYMTHTQKSLWQYDLSSGDSATIANSYKSIVEYPQLAPAGLADLQIAVDGKIYITRYFANVPGAYGTYLAVINNPNDTGNACNFVLDGFQCNQYTYQGLPNVIHNLWVNRKIVRDTVGCSGDTLALSFDDNIHLDSATWTVGDNTTPQQFSGGDSTFSVVIDSVGWYPITAITYSGCRVDTFFDSVLVIPSPLPDLGPDTILCEGDTIDVSNDWLYSYLWSTGDSTQGIQILQPDTIWLELTNFCGTQRDTVVIDSIIAALVNFPASDTLLCNGQVLPLDATVDAGTYTWSNGFTGPVLNVTTADTFWVESQNACATSSDTISVRFTDVPALPALDAVLCVGDTHFINLVTDSLSTFLWYNGDTIGLDTITQANASYWVEETNLCGSDVDSFFVAYVTDPAPFIGADTLICANATLTLDASAPFASYQWSTGDTTETVLLDSTQFASDSALFAVTVTNACGSAVDTTLVVVDHLLAFDLGPDTVLCGGADIPLQVGPFDRSSYLWSDSSTTFQTFARTQSWSVDSNVYSVSVTNACGTFTDSMLLVVDGLLNPDLGPDRRLCAGDSLLLSGGSFARAGFLWNDSSSAPERWLLAGSLALPNGEQSPVMLSVTNECGTFSDTVNFTVDSLPVSFLGDTTLYFCEGRSVNIFISADDIEGVEWQDGSSLFERRLKESMNWTLTYMNRCGTTNDTLRVVKRLPPSIALDDLPLLCDDYLVLGPSVESEGAEWSYQWSDGSTLPDLLAYKVGEYAVTVTDDRGCNDSLRVIVKNCGNDFYAPTAFTPDGNAFNQYWKPVGEGIEYYRMDIYNRWGEVVYSFTQNDQGWDGTYQGTEAPLGVYLWKMELKSSDFQTAAFFEGRVTLLR